MIGKGREEEMNKGRKEAREEGRKEHFDAAVKHQRNNAWRRLPFKFHDDE